MRELLHDDNYIVYNTAGEGLLGWSGAGLRVILEELVRATPAAGLLWTEVLLTGALSDGLDLRRELSGYRDGPDGSLARVASELWDSLWLEFDAAEPGGRGLGVTPEQIDPGWESVDWLRLSRVFLPLHAAQAVPGLAGLDDERAFRRLLQMAHGNNVHTVEPACEALLRSGVPGIDAVLRLAVESPEEYLLDGITLPIQWAIPGDLRIALTDRRDHSPDLLARAGARWALDYFRHAMPPLPGELPRQVEVVRREGGLVAGSGDENS